MRKLFMVLLCVLTVCIFLSTANTAHSFGKDFIIGSIVAEPMFGSVQLFITGSVYPVQSMGPIIEKRGVDVSVLPDATAEFINLAVSLGCMLDENTDIGGPVGMGGLAFVCAGVRSKVINAIEEFTLFVFNLPVTSGPVPPPGPAP